MCYIPVVPHKAVAEVSTRRRLARERKTRPSSSSEYVYTQTLLHTDAFTHKNFYTQTVLHTDAFTRRRFYTQTRFTHAHTLSHTNAFTHRRVYTQTLLHTDAFTRRCFLHTHTRFHTQTLFTHRRFYTERLLHTDTFTQTKASIAIFPVFDVQRPFRAKGLRLTK